MSDSTRPVTGFHARTLTPQEALDAIGRLCDEREHGPGPGWVAVDEVRAVLAAATPRHPRTDPRNQPTPLESTPPRRNPRRWNTTASLEWNERRNALAARLGAVSDTRTGGVA